VRAKVPAANSNVKRSNTGIKRLKVPVNEKQPAEAMPSSPSHKSRNSRRSNEAKSQKADVPDESLSQMSSHGRKQKTPTKRKGTAAASTLQRKDAHQASPKKGGPASVSGSTGGQGHSKAGRKNAAADAESSKRSPTRTAKADGGPSPLKG